ncbi:CelD/BcsL family acetyltransferase involved in cellulose biosynthesis [Rhodoblastus sphagnicola]|uniref:GNAT family N-acetyltransferase n=1 Tax=Rhodoblastus sphagnicola TaxID=333368 RepID=UPI001304F442|nr:GNAT family N-acetyltransferase [Rhodoblastus sphagnicola]MBB4197450.1 CelD/BcsL family acetyltransferase involved in cellulose biosynthesis [Rhodoblastus sphagnicola]
MNGLSPGALDAPRSPEADLARGADDSQPPFPHFLECLGVEEAQNYTAEWADLCERALEPNIFFAPGFALNAARHIPGSGKPEFLFCWEAEGVKARGRLLGVWPLLLPQSTFSSLARSWSHDYGCSGAPLLDRARAPFALERMTAWLRQHHRHLSVLETTQLVKTNPDFIAMSEHARRHNLPFKIVGQYDRARLDATPVAVGARDFISSRKRKELQRQYRRLRELGAVAFHVTRDADDLRAQIEAYMLLEAKGWKGEKGTAFLNDAGLATFLRAMSRTLGLDGKCRIYWLSLNQKMIAGNIVLLDSRGGAYFWKTTYDEDYRSLSPGVLLTMDMTDRLLEDKDVATVDSCAVANHPMIDHLWRGRLCIADVMMGAAPDRAFAFNVVLQREKFRRSLRERVKTVLARIKAR